MTRRKEIDAIKHELALMRVEIERVEKINRETLEKLNQTLDRLEKTLNRHQSDFQRHEELDNARFSELMMEIKKLKSETMDMLDHRLASIEDHIKRQTIIEEYRQKQTKRVTTAIKLLPTIGLILVGLWLVVKAMITAGILVI